MEKPRCIDYRFKLLYALAIVMVVCSHTDGGSVAIWENWFPRGGVQLALFTFASGYFFKPEVLNQAGRYTWKKIKHLLGPFYLYNFFYAGLVLLLTVLGFQIGGTVNLDSLFLKPLYNGHQFFLNLGSWYVAPLLCIQLINLAIRKFFSWLKKIGCPQPSEGWYFCFFVALGVFGNYLAILGYRVGWWLLLARTLHLLPFYALGIYYRACLEPLEQRLPTFPYLAVLFLMVLFA